MRKFVIPTIKEITELETTDAAFQYYEASLKRLPSRQVVVNIHAYSFPKDKKWAVFTGLGDALELFRGKNLDVSAVDEGTIFRQYMPLLEVRGAYIDIAKIQTPVLGILRHYCGVTSATAYIKSIIGDKPLLFYGARAVHPSVAGITDRAAYMGGTEGYVLPFTEKLTGNSERSGNIPRSITHSYILYMGELRSALQEFARSIDAQIPIIALCDTWADETVEALCAAQTLKERLFGVRIDTPYSRSGDLVQIINEVRWTLQINGFSNVKIVVSGNLDENKVLNLKEVADIFGVGTYIACPSPIPLSMDIVEVDGRATAKKGKFQGKKYYYRCSKCLKDFLSYEPRTLVCCGMQVQKMLKPVVKNGRKITHKKQDSEIRNFVLHQLKILSSHETIHNV